jgi:ParB/RepB/Spo0J family partition protein
MLAPSPQPDFEAWRGAIDAARDAMLTVIEARAKTEIVRIFIQVRHIRAEAAGSETYFEEAKNAESQHKAREVRLNAECLMGQWLTDLETAELRYMGRPGKGTKIGTPPDPELITLDDLGIDRHESQRWQAVAKLTAEKFAAMVADDAAKSALLRQLPESRSAQGPKVHSIALSSISISSRLRALRQEKVDALAGSMRDRGLINPITVRRQDGGHRLIAGHHRLEAARKLGSQSIPAIVLKGLDAVDAELVEIDENLVRADLTAAEQAAHHARRKDLYQQRYPETKSGQTGRSRGTRYQHSQCFRARRHLPRSGRGIGRARQARP